jgi:hypothetical protein
MLGLLAFANSRGLVVAVEDRLSTILAGLTVPHPVDSGLFHVAGTLSCVE